MSKAGKQRQRERAAQRRAERQRKERRRRLRNYGIVALVVLLIGGAITAAVIADSRAEDGALPAYLTGGLEHVVHLVDDVQRTHGSG